MMKKYANLSVTANVSAKADYPLICLISVVKEA